MPDLTRFSVATANLFNLQLPGRRMHRFSKPWTEEEFARKSTWLGLMLRELDADVMGVQELWHTDALAEVLRRNGLEETYDLLATPADGTKIVCGALVRKGLLSGQPEWVTRFPDGLHLESTSPEDPQAPDIKVTLSGFSRPVLTFEVALRGAPPLTRVYVAHLKSKLPAEVHEEVWYEADPDRYRHHRTAIGAALSTIRRTAEAAALRVLLTEATKGTVTPVIVLGDLNDGQLSNTLNILTEQPRYLVGDSRGGGDIALYSGQTLQEYRDTRDVYYTHVHNDMRESLDHVLVSEQFYDNSHRRLWLFDGLVIYNDHLNDTTSADHKRKGTGDHGLVKVTFRWRPARQS